MNNVIQEIMKKIDGAIETEKPFTGDLTKAYIAGLKRARLLIKSAIADDLNTMAEYFESEGKNNE